MATPVFIPQWLFVRLEMSFNGQQVINTHSYKYAGSAPGVTALTDFATGWWNAVKSQYQATTSNNLRFLSVTVRDMGASSGGQVVYNIPGTVLGGLIADPLPPGATLAIGTRSATVGRFSRGRFFLPPSTEDQQSAGIWSNAFMSLITNLTLAVGGYTGPVTLPANYAVASRKKVALYLITNLVWDNLVDSMRKRLIGRGR